MNTKVNCAASSSLDDLERDLLQAARRIAPSFDVRDLIAVNPFLGYTDMSFLEAAVELETVFHEEILPPSRTSKSPLGPRLYCVADLLREHLKPQAASAPLSTLTRFLATWIDEGRAYVTEHGREPGLYAAYQRFAASDRSCDIAGLCGFRQAMRAIPSNSADALAFLEQRLELSEEHRQRYFSRLFARLIGYAGYLRARDFSPTSDTLGQVPELGLTLLAQDYALACCCQLEFSPKFEKGEPGFFEDRRERLLALEASEKGYLKKVVGDLRPKEVGAENRKKTDESRTAASSNRPAVQMIFCIDVRSELFRRGIEQFDEVETYGFAGFFGLPLAVAGDDGVRPHCPPLVRPSLILKQEKPEQPPEARERERIEASFEYSVTGPVSSLLHVEAWGLSYVPRLLADTFAKRRAAKKPVAAERGASGLPLQVRVELAASILKNSGLGRPYGRLVVLTGHASHVTNNPQEAALACGACAGHSGETNARLAAALLNDPEVRQGLVDTPFAVPGDVCFLAAVHETVTDTVRICRDLSVPESHRYDVVALERMLEETAELCRRQREEQWSLLAPREKFCAERRGRDYSETQPEWGLAGNTGFLIGPRQLSRQVSLEGRTFLHSYDEELDKEGDVLEMILTAPAIVGSWINLQYYASTVAPRCFGSGHKTLHNPVSGVGIVEGEGGDLVTGLSRESLRCAGRSMHEPMRLQILVCASEARVRQIVVRHESLRRLVAGSWVRLGVLLLRGGSSEVQMLESESFASMSSPEGAVAAE